MRTRVTLGKGDAVKIRLNHDGGKGNEIILARWRTFLTLQAGGYAVNDYNKIKPGKAVEVVVVNERGTGRLYLDGWLVIENQNAFRTQEGCIGIGVNNGEARFDAVEILALP